MTKIAAQKPEKDADKPPKEAKNDHKQAENSPKDDKDDQEVPVTQQIKFLRSHPAYAYWPGETADLTAEHVTLLVEGGFAELAAADTETEE